MLALPIRVGEGGEVAIVNHMGDDITVVDAARGDYSWCGGATRGEGGRLRPLDQKLIRAHADAGLCVPFSHAVLQFWFTGSYSVLQTIIGPGHDFDFSPASEYETRVWTGSLWELSLAYKRLLASGTTHGENLYAAAIRRSIPNFVRYSWEALTQ